MRKNHQNEGANLAEVKNNLDLAVSYRQHTLGQIKRLLPSEAKKLAMLRKKMDYYNGYIKDCEDYIKEHERYINKKQAGKGKGRRKNIEMMSILAAALIIVSAVILLTLQFSELTGFTIYGITPPEAQAGEPDISLPETELEQISQPKPEDKDTDKDEDDEYSPAVGDGYEIMQTTCTCNSCTDCTNDLNNASCDIVELTQDITTTSTCINDPANFNNKILDCKGYTMHGDKNFFPDEEMGIYLNAKTNVTIRNCNFHNFTQAGIRLQGTTNSKLINITVNSTIEKGIHLWEGANYNNLTNITCYNVDSEGLNLEDAHYNNVSGLITYSCSNGVFVVVTSSHNNFRNVLSYSNIDRGFTFEDQTQHNTLANSVFHTENYGIWIMAFADYNNLTNITCYNINDRGISIEMDTSNNRLIDSNISGSGYGIWVWGNANNNLFQDNIIESSTMADIILESGVGNEFVNQRISSYPTNISFIYSQDAYTGYLNISGVDSAPTDPSNGINISRYLSIQNISGPGPSWLYLNISYTDADVSGRNESRLAMWKYTDSWNQFGWYHSTVLDATNNVVGANITTIGSIYAPLETTPDTVPPSNASVFLNATSVNNYTTDNLTCYANATDDIADPITAYYKWYNNSVEVTSLASSTTIPNGTRALVSAVGSGNTTKNQNWICSVKVSDLANNASWVNSSALTIQNSVPQAQNVILNSTDPINRTNGTLQGFFTYYDADNDPGDNETKWYKDNVEIASLVNHTTVAPGNTTKGESWIFSIRVYDGTVWSSWTNTSALTIVNSAPEAQNVVLNSTDNPLNRTTGTLQGFFTYYDEDGDTQQANETKWYNNSIEVTVLANKTIVSSGNTTKGETWKFSVRVYDGTAWSAFTDSNELTILSIPPTQGKPLLISTSGNNYTTDNLTCYNQSTYDSEGDNVKNIYNWYKNSSSLMVLNMPFEGSTSIQTSTKDYSGNNNDGTVSNAVWSRTAGHDGFGAYDFNRNDLGYIEIPDSNTLDLQTDFTIEGWFKPDQEFNDSADYYQGLFDKGAYQMYLSKSDGKLKFYFDSNSTKKLTALGSGLGSTVNTIIEWNGDLYVGGSFTTAGGSSANYTAKWDGSSWSTFGGGVGNYVNNFEIYKGDLYATGGFTTAGGSSANRIAKWNGTHWSALGSGLSSPFGLSLAAYKGELYVGGAFSQAGGVYRPYIARWNGASWNSVGSGTTSAVYGLAVWNDDLYAVGTFTTAGGNSANRIAKWNGSAWSALGSGLGGATYTVSVYNGELYVGGAFTTAGGNSANRIAKWNGTHWSAVGSGMSNGNVYGLAAWNGDLYAVGTFTSPVSRFAKWNGTHWSTSATLYNYAKTITSWNGSLYIGGYFSYVASRIAKYSSGQEKEIASATTSWSNTWHHFAVTYNNSDIGMYVDSAFENSVSAPPLPLVNVPYGLLIGKTYGSRKSGYGGSDDEQFDGIIDEIHIYNLSLTSEQIQALYQNKTNTIVSNETYLGDVWQCSITPNDGYIDGTTNASDSLTIVAAVVDTTPPSNATVILNATSVNNYTTDNLTCYANATDDIADPLTAYFKWYNNTVEVSNLAGSTTIPNGTRTLVSTVASGNLTAGDNWTCAVKTSDGTNNASWINSTGLIVNAPPSAVNCSCSSCAGCTADLNNPSCSVVNLTTNISAAGTCINDPVNFTGKTFDCKNNYISGNQSDYGIYIASQNNNIIRNCNIHNFSRGIYLTTSDNNNITNINLFNNTYGLFTGASTSNNNLFSNITAYDNSDTGVYMESIYFNNFRNITCHDNIYGIKLISSANNNNLTNITVYENTYGLYMQQSYNTYIRNITARNNTQTGIYFTTVTASANTIEGATIYGNPNGIYLSNSNYQNITRAVIYDNTNGIYLSLSDRNKITDGNLSQNTNYAIYLTNGADHNVFTNNVVADSGTSEFYLRSNSLNNTFINQRISSYPTNISFIYSPAAYTGWFTVAGVDSPPQDPLNYQNISKYVNIINESDGTPWIFLNISYTDPDVAQVNESTLEIWKYQAGNWNITGWNGTKVLDEANNVVGVNITNYGLGLSNIFAPLAPIPLDTIPPSNATVVLNATSLSNYTIDNLTCWANATDELNSTITAYYRWYNNSVEVTSLAGSTSIPNSTRALVSTVGSGNTTKTENWICSVLTSDGTNNASWVNSTSLTIKNSPPTHENPILNATSLNNYTTDNLTCYNQSTYDADGDPVLNTFKWYVNNVENASFENQTTITSNYTSVGEIWRCSVTPNDGTTDGITKQSNNLTIQSLPDTTPPSNATVVLNATSANNYTTDNLTCYANATDELNSTIIAYYRWYNRSIEVANFAGSTTIPNGTLTLVSTVASGNTTKGDWVCSVLTSDGVNNASWINSSTLTIENTLPTHDNPILNSTSGNNLTTDNLTCYNQSTYDLEGDPVKNIYNWYYDGQPFMALNMPFEPSGTQNATDYSGYGNNGTVYGNPVHYITGGYGETGAYRYIYNDYITVADSSALDLQSDFAIEGMFKLNSSFDETSPYYQGLLDKGSYQLYLDKSDGKLKFYLDSGATKSLSSLGSGMNSYVNAITEWKGDLYAVGGFTSAGGTSANRIAKWNGTAWSALGSGLGSSASSLAVYKGDLYAAGGFTTAGGNSANYIAKWNGTHWSALGSGLDNFASALAVYKDELYVSGAFDQAGGLSSSKIAKWNGTHWSAVSGFTPSGGSPRTLAVLNDKLYAGGTFSSTPASYIAEWNGTAWSALGSGMNNFVDALGVYKGELYAGGQFTTAGGNAANHTAKWNGTNWSALGIGLNNTASGMAVWNGELYVAGLFTSPARYVVKWNGTSWSSSGVSWNNNVRGLAVWNGSLYGAGQFFGLINYFAKYSSGNEKEIHSTTSSWDTSWHHFAVSRNSSHLNLYVDGSLESSITPPSSITSNAFDLLIGKTYGSRYGYYATGGDEQFDGILDELRIYNYYLSAQQIQALYNNRTDLIVSQQLTQGDVWMCEITPNDLDPDGITKQSNNLTIPDPVPPSNATVILNATSPYQNTTDHLTCYANATDNSAGPLTVYYRWYNNSVEVSNLAGSATIPNGGAPTLISTVGSGNTTEYESWICSVKTSDEINNASWINSSSLTIVPTGACICFNCTDCYNKLSSPSCNITYLMQDIQINGTSCIYDPTMSHKVFDCNGYSIRGNSSSGTAALSLRPTDDHNIIRNCNIHDFGSGIYLSGTINNTVKDSNLYNNSVYGLGIEGWGNTVHNINAYGNSLAGIELDYANNTNISGINSYSNGRGIRLQYSNNNHLTDITINNTSEGINLFFSSNNLFKDMDIGYTISGNGYGIRTEQTNNNNSLININSHNNKWCMSSFYASNYRIVNMTCSNNFVAGISMNSVSDTIISNLTMFNNDGGVYLSSANNVNLTNVTSYNNNNSGIRFSSSQLVRLLESQSYNNSIGLTVSNTDNSTFLNNFFSDNGYDIYITQDPANNTYVNQILSSYPTNISFSFGLPSGNFIIKGINNPLADPFLYSNIGKYVNISRLEGSPGPPWLFLNISYIDADISGIYESTLEIWRSNVSNQWEQTGWNTTKVLDTANKIISANITSFTTTSVFAPFGFINDSFPPSNATLIINATSNGNYSTDNLTCYAYSTDERSSTITVYYKWYKNSIEQTGFAGSTTIPNGTMTLISTIAAGNLTPGDNWICSALTNDYINNASWVNSTGLIINPSPLCNCTNCTDCSIKLNDDVSCPSGVALTADDSITGSCIFDPAGFNNKIFDCQGHTISGDGGASDYGIYTSGNQNNTIRNCTIHTFGRGVELQFSSNNNAFIDINVYNNTYSGIRFYQSTDNNLTNINTYNNGLHGVYLWSVCHNSILKNINSYNNQQNGILVWNSYYNKLTDIITYNNSDSGIYLRNGNYNNLSYAYCHNNSNYGIKILARDILFENNTLKDNNLGEIFLEGGTYNVFKNQQISSYPTNISFIYSSDSYTGNITIRGVDSPPADPAGYSNISRYVEIINNSGPSWLFLNMSYTDEDIINANLTSELTLIIWRYNGSTWSNLGWNGARILDPANNVAGVNITNYGSIFAPLGQTTPDTTPPSNATVILNATSANNYSSDNLNCYANATDDLALTLTAYYKWYNNSIEVPNLAGSSFISNGTLGLVSTVSSGNTIRNQNWICSVKTSDGTNNASWINSTQLTIRNAAPTHTTPILNSTCNGNTTNENITCYNQSTYDADGDAVTNTFKWYINDIENSTFENQTTITNDYTSSSETWKCSVTPYDGIEYGQTLNASMTILPENCTCTTCAECNSQLNNPACQTVYVLNNLTAPGICISFPADNKAVDCQDNTIKGPGSQYGIYLNGRNNNTARNCKIYDFDSGVRIVSSSSDITLVNITVFNNTNYGIEIDNSQNNNLDDIIAYGNTDGIHLSSASGNTINNTNTYNNTNYGIYTSASSNNNLANIQTYNNTWEGIRLHSSSSNNYLYNITSYKHDSGIELTSSNNNNLDEIISYQNDNYGIYIVGSSDNNISNVRVYENGQGVNLRASTNSTIANVTAYNNSGSGIALVLSTTQNNVFTNITSRYNKYGIRAYEADNNLLQNNTISNNSADISIANGASNNTFINQFISSYPTNISFIYSQNTYAGELNISGVDNPPADPSSHANVSRYMDIINNNGPTWLFLNISYTDADIVNANLTNESTLKIWKYNSSGWYEDGWNTTRVLDQTNNIVGVNITNFASIYAPLGQTPLDTTLTITVISPLQDQTYSSTTVWFNVSTDDPGSWCGYSLDNSANITMTPLNSTYFYAVNTSMTEGQHEIIFYCNNTAGYMNNSGILVPSGITNTPYIWVANGIDDNVTQLYTANGSEAGRYDVGDYPRGVAVDSQGNAWISEYSDGTVTKIASNGTIIGTYSLQGLFRYPDGIAVDADDNIWVACDSPWSSYPPSVNKLYNNGTPISRTNVSCRISGIALDGYGKAWVSTINNCNHVYKFYNNGTIIGNYSIPGGWYRSIAVDSQNNIWTPSSAGTAVKLYNNGTSAGNYSISSALDSVAVDANDNIWITSSSGGGVVYDINNSGSVIANYSVGTNPNGIAIDDSNNIWVVNTDDDTVTKLYNNGTVIANYQVGDYPLSRGDMAGFALQMYVAPLLVVGGFDFYVDTPPSDATVVLNSTSLNNYSEDDLTCYANATDKLSTTLTAYFKWYNNSVVTPFTGSTAIQNGTQELVSTVTYGNTTEGEDWICSVLSSDGTSNASWVNSSALTVRNSPPRAQNVVLSSTDLYNRTNGTLQGFWTFYDIDGDAQQGNETKWYKNNTEVSSLVNLTTVAPGNTTEGETWIFSVRVYDGNYWSDWVNSSSLTIFSCKCTNAADCEVKLNSPVCDIINLTQDITNNPGTFINNPVSFNNKIFDCKGYNIDGISVGYGLYLDDRQNNTIKNCRFTDFEYGIYLVNTSNITLCNNTVYYNAKDGIYVDSSSNNTMRNNTARNNNGGIHFYKVAGASSSYNKIIENTIKNNTDYGILLENEGRATIEDNKITNCSIGLNISNGDNNNIDNNNISDHETGMILVGSYNNVTNNNFFSNSGSSTGLKVLALEIIGGVSPFSGSELYVPFPAVGGINYTNTTNNYIAYNSFWDNIKALEFVNVVNNTVDYNIFWDNNYSICINNSLENEFTGNRMNISYDLGFLSDDNSTDNIVNNLTIGEAYPTSITFTYINGIKINSVELPAENPTAKSNISKYAKLENYTVNSSININVSYDESDLININPESSLRLYRHNGTWGIVPGSAVDVNENIVSANVTSFSDFGVFGTSPVAAPPGAAPSGGVGGTTCNPLWNCTEWFDCSRDGIQIRICIDIKECRLPRNETRRCVPPSCTDGILNQGELKVRQVMSSDPTNISDCGGLYCPPCPTCDDGILNQLEIRVDCGGPCPPCASCFDHIKNQGEVGVDCGGPCPPCLEMPIALRDINLFWLLLILLIALTVSDGYCIYEHYHKRDKLTRNVYEVLAIVFLMGVIILSAALSYVNPYVLVIPISLIIYIIIVTWYFSMPIFVAERKARRREWLAERRKEELLKQEILEEKRKLKAAKKRKRTYLINKIKEKIRKKKLAAKRKKAYLRNKLKEEELSLKRNIAAEKASRKKESELRRQRRLEEKRKAKLAEKRREEQLHEERLKLKRRLAAEKAARKRNKEVLRQERIEEKRKARIAKKRRKEYLKQKKLEERLKLKRRLAAEKAARKRKKEHLKQKKLEEKTRKERRFAAQLAAEKRKKLAEEKKIKRELAGKLAAKTRKAKLAEYEKLVEETKRLEEYRKKALAEAISKGRIRAIRRQKIEEAIEGLKKGIRKAPFKILYGLGLVKTPKEKEAIKKHKEHLLKEKLKEIKKKEKERKILLKKEKAERKREAQKRRTEQILREKELKKIKKLEILKHKDELKEKAEDALNKFLIEAVQKDYPKKKIIKLLVSKGWPKKFVIRYCNMFFKKAKPALSIQERISYEDKKLKENIEYLKKLPEKWKKIEKEKKIMKEKPLPKEFVKKKLMVQEEARRRLKAIQEQLSRTSGELEKNIEHFKKIPKTIVKKEPVSMKIALPQGFVENKIKMQEKAQRELNSLQEQLSYADEKLKENVEYLRKIPIRRLKLRPAKKGKVKLKPLPKKFVEQRKKIQEETEKRLRALRQRLENVNKELENL